MKRKAIPKVLPAVAGLVVGALGAAVAIKGREFVEYAVQLGRRYVERDQARE